MSAPVKVRGGGYGLDAELAQKAAEKYDYDMEDEARRWIEAITQMEIGDNFGEGLRNGVILCELVNKIHPAVVKRIETKSKMPFKIMENVSAFLKACRTMGVNEFDLFETVDLFELKDLGLVVRCLHALGRAVQKNYPQFDGPTLGVKESSQNVRQFSDRQLAQARNAPVLFNMGSMRVMQRREASRAGDVTFGAEAAKSTHRPPPPPPPPSAEKKEMVQRERASLSSPPSGGIGAANWSSPPSSTTSRSSPRSGLAAGLQRLGLSPARKVASPQRSATPPRSISPQRSATPPRSVSPARSVSPPPRSVSPTPRSAGLTGLNRAASSKDMAQDEVQQWIEAVLGVTFDAPFGDYLKNGVVLCQLMNAIQPGSIRRIQTSPMPFKQMENITAFIKACRAVGVAEFDLFETVDLFEQKKLDVVVKCIYALGRTLQKNVPEYTGPTLGVKEATLNKRTFSASQLQEAAYAVPLLAHGGAGIMERLGVDRSASITFKSEAAARKGSEPAFPVAAAAGESSSSPVRKATEPGTGSGGIAAQWKKNMATTNSQTVPSRTVWTM